MTAVMKQVAKWVLTVQEHGDPALTRARLRTCEACPEFDPAARRCGVCGCFMDVKAKLAANRTRRGVQITHCPQGRWGDKHLAERYRASRERARPNDRG